MKSLSTGAPVAPVKTTECVSAVMTVSHVCVNQALMGSFVKMRLIIAHLIPVAMGENA